MLITYNDRLDGAVILEVTEPPFNEGIEKWERIHSDDAWVKLYTQPDIDENGQTVYGGIRCDVRRPGSHPGVRAWWLDPTEPVFTPVYKFED